MAVYTDVEAFARKISSYGKAVDKSQREAVAAAAQAAKTIIETFGGRYGIRGRTGKTVKLGAKVVPPKDFGGNWVAIVKATPPGFWALVEKGAGPHDIRPRKRRKKAVTVPQGIFAVVHHPGTHGAIGHPWEEAMAIARDRVPEIYGDAVVIGTLAKVAG